MILADVKRYLDERSCASLSDMSLHFGIQPHAMRGMLDLLVRKGNVRLVPTGGKCTSCEGCATLDAEVYEVHRGAPGQEDQERPLLQPTALS